MQVELWSYRDSIQGVDLSGFRVEATDGEIGTVDEATYETGAGSIIVDTGPWIAAKKVFLPAGTIDHVDEEDGTVYVDRTKDEIKEAPEFDPSGYADQEYRLALAKYYAQFYE
jgi:hypothetical protein